MCPGSHPQLVAPNDPHADAPLFGCTYSPSSLASLDGLRPYRDAYAAAFPERATELKAIQDRAEARGRTIWSYRLGNVLRVDLGCPTLGGEARARLDAPPVVLASHQIQGVETSDLRPVGIVA